MTGPIAKWSSRSRRGILGGENRAAVFGKGSWRVLRVRIFLVGLAMVFGLVAAFCPVRREDERFLLALRSLRKRLMGGWRLWLSLGDVGSEADFGRCGFVGGDGLVSLGCYKMRVISWRLGVMFKGAETRM